MLDAQTALIIAIVGAVGAVAAATAYRFGDKVGPMLSFADTLPMPPPYAPLPRFLWTKPEVMQAAWRSN